MRTAFAAANCLQRFVRGQIAFVSYNTPTSARKGNKRHHGGLKSQRAITSMVVRKSFSSRSSWRPSIAAARPILPWLRHLQRCRRLDQFILRHGRHFRNLQTSRSASSHSTSASGLHQRGANVCFNARVQQLALLPCPNGARFHGQIFKILMENLLHAF